MTYLQKYLSSLVDVRVKMVQKLNPPKTKGEVSCYILRRLSLSLSKFYVNEMMSYINEPSREVLCATNSVSFGTISFRPRS